MSDNRSGAYTGTLSSWCLEATGPTASAGEETSYAAAPQAPVENAPGGNPGLLASILPRRPFTGLLFSAAQWLAGMLQRLGSAREAARGVVDAFQERLLALQSPGTGEVWTSYYYLGGQRVAMRVQDPNAADPDATYYLVGDHLGSTSVVADETGSYYSELRYTPWGEARLAFGTLPTDYTFTGQKDSDFGLMFYNARWYDVSLNQFTQPDSITPDPGNPADWNRYAYVRNNPINFTDSDGHCPVPPAGTGSGRVLCVAGFIPTPRSQALFLQFTGDDRDFNPYGNRDESSRFWVWIDAMTGEILDYQFHETCVVGGECAGPREADCGSFNNCLTSTMYDDGTIELSYEAICDGSGAFSDAQCGMTVDGWMSLSPAEEGGFDVYLVADDFPNLEGYYYVDGELVQTLFQIQNFSDEEIDNGVANATTALEMLPPAPSNFYWLWADPVYSYDAVQSGGAQ